MAFFSPLPGMVSWVTGRSPGTFGFSGFQIIRLAVFHTVQELSSKHIHFAVAFDVFLSLRCNFNKVIESCTFRLSLILFNYFQLYLVFILI